MRVNVNLKETLSDNTKGIRIRDLGRMATILREIC